MKHAISLMLAAAILAPHALHAQEYAAPAAAAAMDEPAMDQYSPIQQDHDYIYAGIGHYDTFGEEGAADFRAELRAGTPVVGSLKPWAGAQITHEGTFWGGGGLLHDWDVTDNIRVTPSLGAGYYAQGDSDLDLGSALQLRAQIDASYEFKDRTRIMTYLSSHTDLGLGDGDGTAESIGFMMGRGF